MTWKFDANLGVGESVDVVADIVVSTSDSVLANLWPCGTKVKVVGHADPPAQCISMTLFGAKILQQSPLVVLSAEAPGSVIYHRRAVRDDLWNVIELCAGMGVGCMGFQHAGMKVAAAVEWSQPFAEAFAESHPDVPIFHGDIGDTTILQKVHAAHPFPCAMMCGFSCQPFSTGGAQQGALDVRSATLPKTLKAAHLLRAVVVILECVPDAGSNNMVRGLVDTFVQEFGYHLSEVQLKLEDVWVSRRSRWWAVLAAPFIGAVPLPAFVASAHPSIPRDIFQSPLAISADELAQLILEGDELAEFLRYEPQLGRMFLKLDVKAPTALHSWSNQLTPCPCLCRSAGFSHQTLSTRGLFGLLIPLPNEDGVSDSVLPAVRHIHPTEVALLNGVPNVVWPDNLRLANAGLGQMASPLHSVWIAGYLQKHVDEVFLGHSSVDPPYLMDKLGGFVLTLAEMMDFLPVPPELLPDPPVLEESLPSDDVSNSPWAQFRHMGGPDEVTVVHESDRVPYVVRLNDPDDTIAAVAVASSELMGCEERGLKIVNCANGLSLAFGTQARGLCLWFTQHAVLDADQPVELISPTLPWEAEEDPVDVPELSVAPVPTGSGTLEPLASLCADRLILVSEPSITDFGLLQALRAQSMSVEARKIILGNQGTLWADDEIWFHVCQLLQISRKPTWAAIDPLLCAEAIKRPSSGLIGQWLRSLPTKPTALLGVVCVDQHWVPFLWTWNAHCVIATCWDIPGSPAKGLSVLHQGIAQAVGSRTFTVHVVHRTFAVDKLCGICSIRFIDNMLRGKLLPESEDAAFQCHAAARSLFVAHLDSNSSVPRPWIFGAGLDLKTSERLHGLLSEHGVAVDQVSSRATLLLQAVGVGAVQKALQSGQPWRGLKAAANQIKPPFQLVLPAELEAAVSKKAAKGGLKGRKKAPASSSKVPAKPDPPQGLDPAKLVVEEGLFTSVDGEPVGQCSISDLGPFQSGVCLCTVDQAAAYLRAGQLISQGALALVVLNAEESQLATSLSWSFMRVILRCQANGEPILVPAYLVQLGKVVVHSRPETAPSDVLHVSAACLKVAIFRDSVDDWSQVIKAPVKYLLAHVPPLQACSAAPASVCTCPKWHPGVDSSVEDPVLDVWRRQWVSLSFMQSAPEHAEIFIVNLRCVESQFLAVLGCSGRSGIFFEPRSLDAREPHLDFQVLWMPKTEVAELLRLQQCHHGILGLARVGSRFGLRARLADAPELARTLKPGSVFLAAGARTTFEVGPLPFGCDRLTVAKLCAQWKWQARPLHPCRTVDSALGNMWRVQACSPPPSSVVRYHGNEVVITKVADPEGPSTAQVAQVIGNSAVVQMCSKDSKAAPAGPDPWLKSDPWAPFQPTVAPASHDPQASMREFEDRVEKSLFDRLSAGRMEIDSSEHEARFAALELQVQSLTAHQQQMEVAIEESSKRSDSQIASLQSQVTSQIDQQGHHIQGMFQAQLQQIEALLTKRARTE